MKKNIAQIVATGLCTGCGTCVAVCHKKAIRMVETGGGLLFAEVDERACDFCGLCWNICGGRHIETSLLPKGHDPYRGVVLKAYLGYATDPEIRLRGQSGGVVTALLSFLLENDYLQKALVSRMPQDGTLRPIPFWATNREELMRTQGSKYCPLASNAIIPNNLNKKEGKRVIVGLPCHIHSLRNAQLHKKSWNENIEILIGLICDRTQAYPAMDYLIAKAKWKTQAVSTFKFRDKTKGTFPGSVIIKSKTGEERDLPSRERSLIKDYFTPIHCRLCFDKMNILSDICLGDAWGINESSEGFSVIIARTQKGMDLLQKSRQAGYLSLEQIDPENIFKGQNIEGRRRQWAVFTKTQSDLDKKVPDFGFYPDAIKENEKYVKKAKWKYQWSENISSKIGYSDIIKEVGRHQAMTKIKNNLKWLFIDRWI